MDGYTSGGEGVDIDWNTDDELEIFGEVAAPPSHPVAAYSAGAVAVTDNGEASSSTGVSGIKLINHFVGMGFPEKLVAKVIEENGEGDTDSILNTLLTYSYLYCISLTPLISLELLLSSVLPATVFNGKSEVWREMRDDDFNPRNLCGVEQMDSVDFITLEDSPDQSSNINSDPSSSDYYNEFIPDDISDMGSWSEDDIEDDSDFISERHKMLLSLERAGSLSEKERKLLDLAKMGYTLEEAQIAMDRCGPEASVSVLTDFICAAQMAREEDCYLQDDLKIKLTSNGDRKNKKRKFHEMCRRKEIAEEAIRLPNPMIGFGVPSLQPEHINRSLPESARGPPYFYYENVALAPKGVWDTISRHLYDIEPEFVDSKHFSATARKRGYVHNLPIGNRFPIVPIPPLTTHQAFPLTKRWWPSWDTRDKLNCIQTAIGSAKLTERIRTALERYDDEPPETVKKYVLEQCRKWNLVWVGRNKAAPLEPDEVEMLLGFPKNHTRGGGISRTDRYKSLGNSFQVDTVAYHLSVLKDMYPNGINILSLFSGIGGAEVALNRLGIKLKNVVSVEKSKVNRDIVRSWWEQTNQTGNLIDFDDVQQIDTEKLEQLADSINGFDLVIGGSPCNNLSGSNRVSRDGLEGKESSLFFEYVRILDSVRSIMRNREV